MFALKSTKDTNTMMKSINSLTNVSSGSGLDETSRLLFIAVLLQHEKQKK